MIQYNLRIDKGLKTKVRDIAHKEGMSENFIYNQAIGDYVRRREQEEFLDKVLARKIPDQRIQAILGKVKRANLDPIYKEDL